MRVAQIYRSIERLAGRERFILETSRELARRRIETRIYTTFVSSKLLADSPGGVETKKVDLPTVPVLSLYSSLVVSKRLIDAAASWADIIILHSGLGVADYAWQKYELPCVPFFHSDTYDTSLFGALRLVAPVYTYPLRVLESKCIRTIPIAFANSHSLSSRIRGYFKCGKLVVIPLGVDMDRFHPSWDDEDFILMAGRFHPTNNFELGLAAASKTHHKVVIAGIQERGFSWYYRSLQHMVEMSQELRNRVEFLSPNDDELIRLMQDCSVFLSPRRYDYLGLAALEAMACGKPVIAHKVEEETEGLPPVLTCGGQVWKWQEALTVLMTDKDLRQKIGRKSREFVEGGHAMTKSVDLMLDSVKATMW